MSKTDKPFSSSSMPISGLEGMMFERNTQGIYERLKNARVGIAGLGGLGSNIAISLARTGIGFLRIVDFDIVEPSNLNRQHYRLCHLGMNKADALKQQITEINPFIAVEAQVLRVVADNVAKLFEYEDVVCEAFDDPVAKAMLAEKLLTYYPSKALVAASGMAGYGSGNEIVTKRFSKNFYVCGDGKSAFSQGSGVMSPRVMLCAAHQANMVLRLVMGENEV